MLHKNYYEIRAKNYFDLGFQEGQLFGVFLRQSVKQQKKLSYGDTGLLTRAKAYLKITKRMFPYLLEELEGYAEGARVPFDDLWLLSLEDELFPSMYEKCTTVITNHGLLIAHNEDWDVEAMDAICVLKKTVQGLTILELYYLNTLGGNAISVNSNGFVQTINTLTHSDTQIGVPKNIIARWLSETNDPESDFKRLEMIQRASGYSHNFCRTDGAIWNFECSAKEQILLCPNAPFIHTNHFLTRLGRLENDDNSSGTINRYNLASSKITSISTFNSIKRLMSDTSQGPMRSIFNAMTIAKVIVDLEKLKTYIWLLREKEKGWLEYDLDFISLR